MTTTAVELPGIWDDARDVPFFSITARLFPPEFCFGAGVLLASYDDDATDDPSGSAASATHRARQHAVTSSRRSTDRAASGQSC